MIRQRTEQLFLTDPECPYPLLCGDASPSHEMQSEENEANGEQNVE